MNARGMERGRGLLDGGNRVGGGLGRLASLWNSGFHRLIDRVDAGLEKGSILARLPDGRVRRLGGRAPGFEAEIDLRSWRALARLATSGSVGWYRAWEEGEWDSPDPVPLFALFMANGEALGNAGRAQGLWRLAARIAHGANRNSRAGARRNIHAHYDLGNDFYMPWLDPSMTYSSAVFDRGGSLEEAQRRKWDLLAERLGSPGTVLEIGCGWGSLAHYLAGRGARVTAISLSDEQLAWARDHQDPSIDFRKQDYRDVAEQFDAIVSVEMVEAVGREYWPAYFDCLARCLKPGGRAALQYIAMKDSLFDAYANSVDFIQAYIFPGGLLIRESEFRQLAEERGLSWEDQRDFGLDYAETLRLWRERFDAVAEEGRLPPGFDRRFVRLWRFYLMYCEGGFRGGGITVSQVTLAKAG
ncbi:MAG: cyclopropane-fatty-acyl-phospholipid synthase [Novosphingobium sp.]|nr:cyclopropane-fatty-acyl-phospholipid synthase [Novosphingobium sp.]